jgi:sporulation protein YlmC with PRC-barrel domain
MQLSATTLIGDSVKNASGDDLGNVEDLMINTETGDVEYAVLSFGGFLGIGDKLFAVPLEVMKVDTKHKRLVLDESKERLEKAPGFDKDQWPNHADAKWQQSVRSYYNLQPRA